MMLASQRLEELPGPMGLPLLGNLLQLDVTRLHLILEEWAERYGPVFRFRVGGHVIVTFDDAEVTGQALRQRPDVFRRIGNIEGIFQEMGASGVFSAEGADWRRQRRLAMVALAHRNLEQFFPTLQTVTDRLYRRWQAAARDGRTLDLQKEFMLFTVDATTWLAFGRDVNTIERGDDDVQRHLKLVFPAIARRINAPIPYWRYVRLPADRKLERSLDALRRWLEEMVEETKVELSRRGPEDSAPRNFLEAMLQARDDADRPFTPELIFGNAMTMLLGGEDTTANTLAWSVHYLCGYPAEAARMRGEADDVLGAASLLTDIGDARRMTFATAIANEALRLRPVAPLFFLECNEDVVLRGVSLPRGTRIALLTRPATLDPARFPDPRAFRPARWLELDDDEGSRRAAFVPFGSGPRICPGRSLALLEIQMLLAMLYRNFDVKRVGSPSEVRERFNFAVEPVGIKVRLEERR